MEMETSFPIHNIGILDSIGDDSINEILEGWNGYCVCTELLLKDTGDLSVGSEFVSHVHVLCKHGLDSLVQDHFLRALEETFEKNGASKFWQQFDAYSDVAILEMNKPCIEEDWLQQIICKSLEEISLEKQYQEKCLLMLVHALQSYKDSIAEERHNLDVDRVSLLSRYQLMVSSVLMTTLPRHFPGMCFRVSVDDSRMDIYLSD
ncbi:hypothetical protein HHK36_015375 [Tetracentron sinense]|uniref:Uncharacterized protein n=1 Tax=Tetracentron sinense TaxID=13715 RepID=A0A835DDK7_TETSI|nr:hypothetical protein HHK36_015375 [Tetracentron sinense]